MRRHWSIVVAVLSIAAGSAGVVADEATNKKELQAAYDRAVQAYRSRDLKSLMTLFAPDFVNTSPDGTRLARPEVEEGARQLFAALQDVKEMSLKPVKVTLKGDRATATTDLRLNATLVDSQGHQLPFVLRQVSTDTWTRTPRGWRMLRRDELSTE
jgi:ketosteroid isomerase-like protein